MKKRKVKHNNKMAILMKNTLQGIITDMANDPSDFVVTPGVDFTRRRKLDFETLLNLMLSMKGGSIEKEMYQYFDKDPETATASAFIPQRAKLRAGTFEYPFRTFNSRTAHFDTNTYDGYRLLAVDGSDINIARDTEAETYFEKLGYNQFHLNALYDVLNKTYTDALIQAAPKEHESRAAIELFERNEYDGRTILMADRGYESFCLFEHVKRKDNLDYLVRIRNNGTKEAKSLPMADCDKDFSFEMRGTQTKEDQKAYKDGTAKPAKGPSVRGKGKAKVTWDLELPCLFSYRVVRFEIAPGEYETIATSLDRDEFPPERIKELYHLRWGIETSFRELKYAIGMLNFHARKEDFIKQEIFAMLTMYNFCERITLSVVIEKSDGNKHVYQVNFTMAIHICRDFFALPISRPPPDVAGLIARYVLPVREGRSDKRKLDKSMAPMTFTYRIAA